MSNENWLKFGDILLSVSSQAQILRSLNDTIQNSYFQNFCFKALKQHYQYRYLCFNDAAKWIEMFQERCSSITPETQLRLTAYLDLNNSFFNSTHNMQVNENGNSSSTITYNNTTNQNETKIDTSIKEDSIRKTGNTTTNNTTINTSRTQENIAKTGSITRQSADSTTASTTGAKNNSTSTKDDNISETTNSGFTGDIGVKTTNVVPSADTVTKTITTAIVPPMNASGYVAGQGQNQSIYADNITTSTPFDTTANYNSSVTENVTYNNLQRESNGNYKSNLTTETFGSFNVTTESYEPLKHVDERVTKTQQKRPENVDFNTVVTGVENSQDTGNTSSTGNETETYNNLTDTKNFNGLDDATHNIKVTNSTENNLTDTHRITGLDDATHNVNTENSLRKTGNDTTQDTKSSSSTTSGFSGDKSALYKNYIDAVEKSDFVVWFYRSFRDLFSVFYEMDDRNLTDVSNFENWEV